MSISTGSEYVSMRVLARGGMGEVELGLRRAGAFSRMVAIKRLRSEHRADTSFRRMFLDEATIAGQIHHPNVVPVLDVGEDGRGPFLVMEFIEGITASTLLKKFAREARPLPIQVVARIAEQTALGLAAAHGLRDRDGQPLELVHRDISPQNVLIGFDGVPRLTDFGIAKALTSGSQTTTGMLKGKAGYMAPEQLRFEHPTQRSDLFSFGVFLYELMSGERLYGGRNTVDVAQRVLSEAPPDIYSVRDDVPPELIELSFELLAKDPVDRPASAAEIAARLREVVDDLVAREGPVRIEDFLSANFGQEKDSLRTMQEETLREWEVATTQTPTKQKNRSLLPAAVVLLSVVGGGALAAAVTDSPEEPPAITEAPESEGAVESPAAEEGAVSAEGAAAAPEGTAPETTAEEAGGGRSVAGQEAPAPEEPVAGGVAHTPETTAQEDAIAERQRARRRRRQRRGAEMAPAKMFRAIDHVTGY